MTALLREVQAYDALAAAAQETPRAGSLADVVDAAAEASGSWVVVERFGRNLCHGVGSSPCPEPLAQSLLTKELSAFRRSVVWSGRGTTRVGRSGDTRVTSVDLGEGAIGWLIGGDARLVDVPLLRHALDGHEASCFDPLVHDYLKPRSLIRQGAAPSARLILLRSPTCSAPALARSARRAAAGYRARLHVQSETVVLVLPADADTALVAASIRRSAADVTIGTAVSGDDVADWTGAFELASRSLRAAQVLALAVGDAADPRVAAAVVVEGAAEVAGQLWRQLPTLPLQKLEEYDRRSSGDLVGTLIAWCRSGCDTAAAAAELHVHANTMRYRLRRVSQLTGFDLSTPMERLALQLLIGP